VFAALSALDAGVEIHPEPLDLGESPPFAEDIIHDAYDADAVRRFWRILAIDRARPRPVPERLRRQGEPGAPVLALVRPRPRPLLRATGSGCAGRRPGQRRGTDEVDALCAAARADGEVGPGARSTSWLRRFFAYFTSMRHIAAELHLEQIEIGRSRGGRCVAT
jgi:hypothetical protein